MTQSDEIRFWKTMTIFLLADVALMTVMLIVGL